MLFVNLIIEGQIKMDYCCTKFQKTIKPFLIFVALPDPLKTQLLNTFSSGENVIGK